MLKRADKSVYRHVNRSRALRGNVTWERDLVVGAASFITAPNRLRIGRNCWIACDGLIGNSVPMSSYVAIAGRQDHDMRQKARSPPSSGAAPLAGIRGRHEKVQARCTGRCRFPSRND